MIDSIEKDQEKSQLTFFNKIIYLLYKIYSQFIILINNKNQHSS